MFGCIFWGYQGLYKCTNPQLFAHFSILFFILQCGYAPQPPLPLPGPCLEDLCRPPDTREGQQRCTVGFGRRVLRQCGGWRCGLALRRCCCSAVLALLNHEPYAKRLGIGLYRLRWRESNLPLSYHKKWSFTFYIHSCHLHVFIYSALGGQFTYRASFFFFWHSNLQLW